LINTLHNRTVSDPVSDQQGQDQLENPEKIPPENDENAPTLGRKAIDGTNQPYYLIFLKSYHLIILGIFIVHHF
jgi:hypothetical protein